MNNPITIFKYTLQDLLQQKSVYLLTGVSVLFVLMLRGCYDGHYLVNGRPMNAGAVAGGVSRIGFHTVAAGIYFMAALAAMKLFHHDRSDGFMVMVLSRPVSRWQYVAGRVMGTWAFCLMFMFILHTAILVTVWQKTGSFIPGYLGASLLCSINLLFVVICVCLLTLYLPDFIGVLLTLGLMGVGIVSDGGDRLLRVGAIGPLLSPTAATGPALWRVFYPKLFMLQIASDSVISGGGFHPMGPVHPAVNVLFFLLLIMTALVMAFNRKEI